MYFINNTMTESVGGLLYTTGLTGRSEISVRFQKHISEIVHFKAENNHYITE